MNIFEKELNDELVKRIEKIENPNYEYPKKLNKLDYFFIIFTIILCLIGIVFGAFIV